MVKTKEEKKMDALLIKEGVAPTTPQVGETIKGKVLAIARNQVLIDFNGTSTGVVRGRELYNELEEYKNLQPGDEVEATILESENEIGLLELSFRFAGHKKTWDELHKLVKDNAIIKVKVRDANKGGLLVMLNKVNGFLPVSQLSPENYPRVQGGDKSKILEKLRKLVGKELGVKVITADDEEEKLIVSEKAAWEETQKAVFEKYNEEDVVDGRITAITDFGIFIEFGEKLEGLAHISELAWQRIDNPSDLFKVGEAVKAKIIKIENSKVFLSIKQLQENPWQDIEEKFKVGDLVKGKIVKVNPYGLFVELDKNIQGLAHVSELAEEHVDPTTLAKVGDTMKFKVVSVEPKEYRLGLSLKDMDSKNAPAGRSQKKAKKEEKAELAKIK